MDASRYPSDIGENQYHRACNVQIKRSGGGLSSRNGIHHVCIDFGNNKWLKNLYETGHIQAGGSFNDGREDYLVCAVNGHIILLREVNEGCWRASLVTECEPNNPSRTKGWFTRVPYGVIYNDGEALPLWITSTEARRTDPSAGEIDVGRAGVYVQNRFFYISEDGKEVYFSDFRNPLSRGEAIAANLLSFVAPEDDEIITAIGKQKAMLNYVEGGELVFSTLDNLYSVDVRGPISSWELQSTTTGKVRESVRGVGAVSSYSFEPFNTNIYFRSREFGICDIKQSQYQFVNDDDFTSQSIEVDYWLENDTEWMLDQCYTKGFNGRLYTTIAPEFREDGYVFWNGLVSYHPDPRYSNREQGPRRFEGIITGVRPWCMVSLRSNNRRDRLFFHSYDTDGVNRMYQFTNEDYDRNHHGDRVEIESWVESRGYTFGNEFIPKSSLSRSYKIRDLTRDLLVQVFARRDASGEWAKYFDSIHKVGGLKRSEKGALVPALVRKQNRPHVPLPEEPSQPSDPYSNLPNGEFFSRQDRFQFKGPFTLDAFIRLAEYKAREEVIQKEADHFQLLYGYKPDFAYSIATAKHTQW